MHAIEKILARAAGHDYVSTGEIVKVKVDFAEVNDLYLQTIYSFYEIGGKKVWDKDKLCFVFDHYAPTPTIKAAQNHKEMRKFVEEQGLTHHFDVNAGVCHQVMPEAGVVWPGMILVATDSHTTTHGAFGAFGTVSYTHLRAHETRHDLVCRLLLEKKKKNEKRDYADTIK